MKGTTGTIARACIGAAIAIAAAICAPQAAFADEASIVEQTQRGEEMIDIADYGWSRPETTQAMSEHSVFIHNIPGVSPCLSVGGKFASKGNAAIYYKATYDCAQDQIASRTARYNAEVASVVAQASKEPNIYLAAKCAYAHLLARASYDDRAAKEAANNGYRSTPYYIQHASAASALLDGSSVCVGYAQACVDLFRALGLEAKVIQGNRYGGPHAWVSVVIDGLVCECDPTCDDETRDFARFMVLPDGTRYGAAYLIPEPNPQAATGQASTEGTRTVVEYVRQDKHLRLEVRRAPYKVFYRADELVEANVVYYRAIVEGESDPAYKLVRPKSFWRDSIQFTPAVRIERQVSE